ncbi:MAG TPA: AMP-binding protein [Chlamydiales bacterium]|nr:AMP-binding protein [Chlamydiales bacterium]
MFWNLLKYLFLAILRLRYTIKVTGSDQLKRLSKEGGILFMPNHTAHMDPLFLFILLWPKYRIRPIVTEHIARISFMKPLMNITKGISVPSLSTSVNALRVKLAKEAVQSVTDGLKKNDNFIVYPSGRLKETAKEVIGGSSGAHEILQQCPDAKVVLIRTTGLWGSSFSRAITAQSPDLPKTLFNGIKTLLKNGIFFTPRRKVTIEFELASSDLPIKASRVDFNRYLENWYNRYEDEEGKIDHEEPLKLVSYAFWKKDIPQVVQFNEPIKKKQNIQIQKETEEKVYREIRRLVGNANLKIEPQMNLSTDVGMDSLNIAEIIAFLAQKFRTEEIHPEEIVTVRDVLEAAEHAKTERKAAASSFTFPEEKNRPFPVSPMGDHFAECFLNICQKMGNFVACGDDVSGITTYKRFKRAALVLAAYFEKIPGDKIAILLPSSTGAYLTIFALLLANKTPVMLNWTLGPRYLEEMVRISGSTKVISSWLFIDRASHVDFGNIIDKMELLEDIRNHLSLKLKLKRLFLSFRSPSAILKSLKLKNKDPKDTSVILFTSGTEAMPKGVPLSHANIIQNQKSTMQCIQLKSTDIIYSILPPFHSFGFSVTGILPLLAGLKTAFFPDPTDSYALAEGVERWKITLFTGAPNFIKGLLHAAKPGQLSTIRLFVSGAEKASPELYNTVANLGSNAVITEGYGITECSPVITINRLNLPPRGVGHLLPDIVACTIHPETLELLPQGSEGEILIRGPNVFSGYLENPRSPFFEIEGKKWYRTGDIGYFDQDGYLILSGRLKRFVKIGGEMISLGSIEHALLEGLLKKGMTPSSDSPLLAVCALEKEEAKPEIIVFTTIDLSKEEANSILMESGMSRLIKVAQVRKIVEIPLLGTGKTNYRQLQDQI